LEILETELDKNKLDDVFEEFYGNENSM